MKSCVRARVVLRPAAVKEPRDDDGRFAPPLGARPLFSLLPFHPSIPAPTNPSHGSISHPILLNHDTSPQLPPPESPGDRGGVLLPPWHEPGFFLVGAAGPLPPIRSAAVRTPLSPFSRKKMDQQPPSFFSSLPPSVQHALIMAATAAPPAGAAAAAPPPPPLSLAPLLPPLPPLALPPSPDHHTASAEAAASCAATPTPTATTSSPAALITPPHPAPPRPPQQPALLPRKHIFSGTKAPGTVCGVCGSTTTGGGCWRRLWALQHPAGEWLAGCNRCGLRYRHGKIKPPKSGPATAIAGWQTAKPPPRRIRGAAAAAQQQQQWQRQQGRMMEEEEEEEEEDTAAAEEEEEDDGCDEGEAAAWTLVGLSADAAAAAAAAAAADGTR